CNATLISVPPPCSSTHFPYSTHFRSEPGQLGGGGQVGGQHASGGQGGGGRLEVVPRSEHVQHDPVDAAGFAFGGDHFGKLPGAQLPGGVWFAEEFGDVALGDLGEVLPAFDGEQVPGLPHSTQQRQREPTGAHTGLDHTGTRIDVRHGDDLGGVLGVDDRGASRHGQYVVAEPGPQHQIGHAAAGGHHGAARAAGALVVTEPAAVG